MPDPLQTPIPSSPAAPPSDVAASEDKYAEALRRFSGDLRMTGQVYQSMLDRGVQLQRHHYDLLLKTFLDHRDVIGVKKLLDRMDAEGHDTDPAMRWNIAIASARGGDTSTALAQIDELRKAGIDPPDQLGPEIAGLHISTGNLAAGRAVLRELAAKGIPGADVDYTRLMADCIRRHAINDSLDLIGTMKAVGRVPDAAQATELVVAIARAGNPDRAAEVRDVLLDAGATVGAEAFEAVSLGLLKKNQVREARLEAERMQAAGHRPTSHHRNELALARINSLDADKSWQVAEELDALPTSAVLDALLTKTANAKNFARALGIIDWMLILGSPVPVDGAGKVIDGLLPNELDASLDLLRTLRANDVPVDRRSARHVLDALVKVKRIDEAVVLVDELRAAKSLTRASDHAGVFAGLVRAKRVDDAMALFSRMLGDGVKPRSAEASRFVDELVRAKQYAKAHGILDTLQQAKITVDEPTYRALLWAFAQANDEAGAKAVYDRMVAAGITPDDRHTKALAWASGDVRRKLSDKEIEEAEERLRQEIEAEPKPREAGQEPPEPTSPAAPASLGPSAADGAAEPNVPADSSSMSGAPAPSAPAEPAPSAGSEPARSAGSEPPAASPASPIKPAHPAEPESSADEAEGHG